jgi:undecaprenyl phosphate-alpha-L-ara4FN deformylase
MVSGERILGLKIDVDTRRGMEEGVPALLSALASAGVPATFFLSFGPDNSGRRSTG